MIKQEAHIVKGMQRDLTVSKFSNEFVFEARNIRITARDNNTLLSVTNEKGNKEIILRDENRNIVELKGTIIGYNILNNYLTLFTTDNSIDRIYRLNREGDYFKCENLFTGTLNFNTSYPIKTLGVYENENIQKVYWIDGKNQARVINIVASDKVQLKWTNTSFNFIQELDLNEEITITKNNNSSGSFSSGIIQYAFTYYYMYGQESNIFYTTPLQYISYSSRGASPEEKVSNSFTIHIKNPDPKFDYIRIYSIHRTSIDAVPAVTNITDIAINGAEDLIYVDNGTTGSTVDPSELLYIGGENIVPQTMTHKDNTLFLGNILLNNKIVSKDIRDKVKTLGVDFSYKLPSVDLQVPKGYYSYQNQLNNSSDKILTFKYKDWYRFGLQFQNKTGKWSEPIFIKDAQNDDTAPRFDTLYGYRYVRLSQATVRLSEEIINLAVSEGFIKVRGVVVYPDLNDREVVAQGILCPTVFNVADRYSNSPFAQASWFARPNSPFDINKAKNWVYINNKWYGDWNSLEAYGKDGENSRAGIVTNDSSEVDVYEENEDGGEDYTTTMFVDLVNKGAWAEFRHLYPIPDNSSRNSEIQCIYNPPASPTVPDTNSESDTASWVSTNGENFYIDQSILTFHSPDIEFDNSLRNIDTTGLKLRIVGMVPITACASDIDIQTSTPVNPFYATDSEYPIGFYKESIGSENLSRFGWRGLISGAFWFDELTGYDNEDYGNTNHLTTGFVVYPWHRNGSLNNAKSGPEAPAMLSQKRMSNLRFSAFTAFLDRHNIWEAEIEESDTNTGISGVVVFDSEEQTLVRIPAQANSGLSDINYYGNIDKIIVPSRIGDKKDGYPIITSGVQNAATNSHRIFNSSYTTINPEATSLRFGTDPVSMKYKSTPHAVLALNYTTSRQQRVLPTINDSDYYQGTWVVNSVSGSIEGDKHMFWDKNIYTKSISQDVVTGVTDDTGVYYFSTIGYGWFWLGELYRDKVENRFGGDSEESIENNLWFPAGEPYSLVDRDDSGNIVPKRYLNVLYTEGDTYFQRYDCLKTYPYTSEDQNSIVEIVSFMCETRVNIDGRYDKNRGQSSNLAITPNNFNLLNSVYNQKNNFFNYRALNYNKYSLDYFPNTITWTKEKQAGAMIDTWTNITMASTLDLDGDKGEVVSLNTFNNEIYCFQKQGLSNILFNSRVQIPTSDGMPIEISNGLKVTGKRYISNTIGCNNKWSIVESPSGLYFIDNITNSIYLFNGQINSLSDKLGFRQWINENNSLDKWEPIGFKNFVTYYDKNNGDVYFVNNETALVYSELLGQFTSFMNYGQVPAMFNINNDFYAIQFGKIWEQFAGDYNVIFGYYYPYSITFISNSDEPYDKIFNNIEFRADCWSKDTYGNDILTNNTFDTLEVWNEYQKGVSLLKNLTSKSSSLKKKFRVWRANIPRANTDWNGFKGNNMDRIRNTWAYIKLSRYLGNTERMEFHDMVVKYFI